MGIRLRCIHCDKKLNVKSTQAGKKVHCPRCRGRLRIPVDSDSQHLILEHAKARAAADEKEITAEEVDEGFEPEPIHPQAVHFEDNDGERVLSEAPRNSAEPKDEVASPSNLNPRADFLLGEPGSSIPANYIDPIIEAPHRVWHIRNAKGVESGPFKGRKLRKKIEFGVIKGHFEVCREDWEDWRLASEVFPELGEQRKIPAACDSVYTDSFYEISDGQTLRARKRKQKQRNFVLGIAVLAVGTLITISLCYLLIRLI